jgi:hypothetical protein
MTSITDYKLKVMQLHTTLARINADMLDYVFKMILDNQQNLPVPITGEDPLIMTVLDLRESLMDSNNDLLWMNYLTELETRIASTDYHPESVLYLFKNKSFKKSILRYLHTAQDVLLGLALHLSGTIEPDRNHSGLGLMKVNLLNRNDPNVLLVLGLVSDIKLCIECIELMNLPKSKIRKG